MYIFVSHRRLTEHTGHRSPRYGQSRSVDFFWAAFRPGAGGGQIYQEDVRFGRRNDAGRVLLVVRGELPCHGLGRTWERSCPCTGAPSGVWLAHYGTPGSCRPARAGPFVRRIRRRQLHGQGFGCGLAQGHSGMRRLIGGTSKGIRQATCRPEALCGRRLSGSFRLKSFRASPRLLYPRNRIGWSILKSPIAET